MKFHSRMMLVALLFACPSAVQPQDAGAGRRGAGRGAPGLSSPVIGADRKVTFQVRAPDAKSVSLTSDFQDGNLDLAKGDDGLWNVTVGPLEPDIYYYNLVIDGVRALDPGNAHAKIGFTTNTITSILDVPADQPAFYEIKNVPHGELHTLLYNSKSSGVTRELNVYTPPGYEENPQRRYPVLYLLHGANNDHYSWVRYGRANDILDNVLAEGRAKPFIVVMPLGYGGAPAEGSRAASAVRAGGGADLYKRDVLEDIIPLVDARFRTLADQKHRAIVGFSMGGGQAGRIGLRHLDTFSHVGIFSAGLPAQADAEPLKGPAADVAATNKKLDLLWIACGKDDAAINGARSFANSVKQLGINCTFVESEGAHHWRVWRRYLRDLAPLLFQKSDAN